MKSIARIIVLGAFAWAVITSSPANAEKKLLDLPDGTKVQITLPEGWVANWKVAGGGGTAEISGESGTDALVLITVLPSLPLDSSVKDAPSPDLETLRLLIASLEDRLILMKGAGEVDVDFGERLTAYKHVLSRHVGSPTSFSRSTLRRIDELGHRISNLEGEYSALAAKVGRSRGDA